MSNVNISKKGSFCSYLSAIWAFPTMILAYVPLETSASSASSTESNGASRIRVRKEDLTRYSRPTCPTQLPLGGRLSCLTHASHSIAVRGFFRARRTLLSQSPREAEAYCSSCTRPSCIFSKFLGRFFVVGEFRRSYYTQYLASPISPTKSGWKYHLTTELQQNFEKIRNSLPIQAIGSCLLLFIATQK